MSRLNEGTRWAAGKEMRVVGMGWMAADWQGDWDALFIFRSMNDSTFTIRKYNPGSGEDLNPVLAGPFDSLEAAETAFWILSNA